MTGPSDLAASEEAIVFGTNVRLVGIVTTPSAAVAGRERTGVILLNAGVVHRVGPGRLYVTLARRLARCGFTTLRFDHSGIGDSPPRDDQLNFDQSSVAETVDAMNWLASERGCEAFVLIGLCSGTLTAFRVAHVDSRVTSLVLLTALLLDPSTVPEAIVAEAQNRRVARSFLVEKAASAASWKKLLAGNVDIRRVGRVVGRYAGGRVRRPPVTPANAELIAQLHRLLERGVSVQFIYAEPTTVLEWFRMTLEPELAAFRQHGRIELRLVKQADHTFSRSRHQAQVIELIANWFAPCT
jgi:pimeloyl-ACP methyl ester carboxylesterase